MLRTEPGRHATRGPVRRAERALTPDLARGFMLLFIALANSVVFAIGHQPGVERDPEGVERGVNLFMFTAVHARAYPVFAVMFGYGLVQLARRQDSAGVPPAGVRSMLLRRHGWMVAFGLVHAVLLSFGDFLGAYGLVGLFATVVLLRRSERVHRMVLGIWAIAAVYAAVLAGLVVAALVSGPRGHAGVPVTEVGSLVATDYGTSILERLGEWPTHTATVLPFVFIVWLGMLAARHRVLEDPTRHRVTLRWVAGVGLGTACLGGLPLGLVSAGMLHVDASAVQLMSLLYGATGMFGGPGYVALFGLVAPVLTRSTSSVTGTVTRALAALGQRSLTGYLLQSLAWVLLLSPYTLALGRVSGSPTLTAAGVALLTWLATVVWARLMDRRSRYGPAETVLRRLTYSSRGPRRRGGTAPGGRPGHPL